MRSLNATDAYKRSATYRSVREQEADIFRRVNNQLRVSTQGCSIARAKALADNERLWITLTDLLRDPDNALPASLKASIISVGGAVRREITLSTPDIAFLININESVAAGLSSA